MTLNEVSPPGYGATKGEDKGGTAAAFDKARKEGRFKGSKSDMFAIMWSQKNKGIKPQYKPGTDKKYKKYQEEEVSRRNKPSAIRKRKKLDSVMDRYNELKRKVGSAEKHNKPVMVEESNPRIPRKKGQPANSKKHSDLYTDENP